MLSPACQRHTVPWTCKLVIFLHAKARCCLAAFLPGPSPSPPPAHRTRETLTVTCPLPAGFVPPSAPNHNSFYQGNAVELNPGDSEDYSAGLPNLQRDSVNNPVLANMEQQLMRDPMRHRKQPALGCFAVPK